MREYAYNHEKGKLPPTLAKIEFLGEVDQEALDAILENSSLVEFDFGESILREGDSTSEFYILLKGEVQIAKDGKPVALVNRQGELLGEQAALHGGTRSASLTAASHCFLLRVDPEFLDSLSDGQRTAYELVLYRFLSELLARRLAETSARVAELEAKLGDQPGTGR